MTPVAKPLSWGRRFIEEDNESQAATTIYTIREKTANFQNASKEVEPTEKQGSGNVVFIVGLPVDKAPKGVGIKYCRRPTFGNFAFYIEATEEQLGLPGDTVASMCSWPTLWRHPEHEPRIWRGVFSPLYPRKRLFSQQIEIRTADLPRWKPHITIDRHALARKEEDE